jgi:hypothetical protein
MTIADLEKSHARNDAATENVAEAPVDATPAAKPASNRRQLSLLGLALACAAGVCFAMLKNSPQSASAAPTPAPAASSEVAEFLAGDATVVRNMQRSLRDANRISDESRFSPGARQVPVTELKTDPFRLRVTGVQPVEVPDDSNESRQKEIERQAILRSVQSLQLQSILRGDSHRACLINNTLYQEGQTADGFVIEEIALTSVVVRKGVYRFDLKMTK